jgi:hypothetical protein
MNERDHKTAMTIAQVSESVGMIICVAGVMIGLALMSSGHLMTVLGFAMGLSGTLPTLAGGLLLIVAGRVLRAVIGNANASAEILQIMQGADHQSPCE